MTTAILRRLSLWAAGASLAAGIMLGGSYGAPSASAAPAADPNPPTPSVQSPPKKPSPPVAGKATSMRVVVTDGNVVRARVSG